MRGFRIELGEIEHALRSRDDVEQAVVLLREQGEDDQRLVAYVVCGSATTPALLARHLAGVVPAYMVPAHFVRLESMPLSPAGKIDRGRLAAIDPSPPETADDVAPRDATEAAVAAAFADVLAADHVGAHDDFFARGGHSLLGTRLVSRLRSVFEVELPVSLVFEAPTVAELAGRIEAARRAGAAPPSPPVEPVERGGRLPLSFAQRRLWFLDQLGAGAAYNVMIGMRHEGRLDEAVLRRALAAVADRHEVLRTSFLCDDDGRPYQRVAPSVDIPVEVVDVTHLPRAEAEREVRRRAGERLTRPFDLERGPLLHVMVARLDETADALIVIVHHIASDGWSLGLLGREIAAHYAALADDGAPAVAALPVQYADFAAWQNRWLDERALAPQIEYWTKRLGGTLPVLQLPVDRPRPAVQSFRGASHPFEVTTTLHDALRAFNRAHGVTMAMTLLAGFKVLLARYTGQDDVVVGSPVAGRTRAEIENLIGFFVNSVVLRTDLSGDPTFETVVERVRRTSLEAYDHQDLPFERLVDELDPERDLGQNPLFQVVFAMQHELAPLSAGAPGAAAFHAFPMDVTVTRTDVELHLFESVERLHGRLIYNTDLFDGATIERMLDHFLRLLEAAVATPTVPVGALPLLADAERDRVLVEWNRTDAPYPDTACIHELIEARAAAAPDAPAVVFGGESMSYRALNAAANRLAHALRDMGVVPDTRVALCVERGPEMIVGLLGILKAGGAYVPIDPAYPTPRVEYMLGDCAAPVLVTQSSVCSARCRITTPGCCASIATGPGSTAVRWRTRRSSPRRIISRT